MKKMFLAVTLFTVFSTIAANAQQRGWMSRYWDGCKPSCSWVNNAGAGNLCKECDVNNNEINPPSQVGTSSSCDGGGSYTCWDQIPFVDPNDPNLAYAFAATPGGSDDCGACYELTFDGGQTSEPTDPFATNKKKKKKKLIVMASNIGWDVGGGQFDLLVPGGGLGNFDSFSGQLGLPSNFHPSLGVRHGGLVSACQEELVNELGWWEQGTSDGGRNVKTVVEEWQVCLRNKCNEAFSRPEHALLREGCIFYADWFMAADNPTLTFVRLNECPAILADRYHVGSGGGVPTPGVVSVRHNVARTAGARTDVTFRSIPKGFTAALPANHRFTSYRLIDLQGREIRSGTIGGASDLRFNNIKRSVLFLQLNGADVSPAVLRVVTY